MEEKKLTDEEIVKALEFCAKDSSCLWDSKCPLRNDKDCHVTLSKAALAFINRQNKDYIELDLEARELRTELDKELAEHEEFTKKAKEEIERLTIAEKQYLSEIERLNKSCGLFDIKLQEQIKETYDYVHKADKLKKRNAELQKQVDELKAENAILNKQVDRKDKAIVREMNIGYENERQAVKDTAKEILGLILAKEFEKGDYLTDDELHELFKERYGVEVK